MTGNGIGMDGKPSPHRMVWTHKDASTLVFDIHVTPTGMKEMKVMTMTYKRRVGGKAVEASSSKK